MTNNVKVNSLVVRTNAWKSVRIEWFLSGTARAVAGMISRRVTARMTASLVKNVADSQTIVSADSPAITRTYVQMTSVAVTFADFQTSASQNS